MDRVANRCGSLWRRTPDRAAVAVQQFPYALELRSTLRAGSSAASRQPVCARHNWRRLGRIKLPGTSGSPAQGVCCYRHPTRHETRVLEWAQNQSRSVCLPSVSCCSASHRMAVWWRHRALRLAAHSKWGHVHACRCYHIDVPCRSFKQCHLGPVSLLSCERQRNGKRTSICACYMRLQCVYVCVLCIHDMLGRHPMHMSTVANQSGSLWTVHL